MPSRILNQAPVKFGTQSIEFENAQTIPKIQQTTHAQFTDQDWDHGVAEIFGVDAAVDKSLFDSAVCPTTDPATLTEVSLPGAISRRPHTLRKRLAIIPHYSTDESSDSDTGSVIMWHWEPGPLWLSLQTKFQYHT